MDPNQQTDNKTCCVQSLKYNLAGHYTVVNGPEFYVFTLVRSMFPNWDYPIGTETYIPVSEEMGKGDWCKVTPDKITVRTPVSALACSPSPYVYAKSIKDGYEVVLKGGYYTVLQTSTCYLFILKKTLTSYPDDAKLLGKATEIPLTKEMGKSVINMKWYDDFIDVTPDKITKV
jgi:hypothetical protein